MYREYGARNGREREREKVGPRDTFVDHLYDPWFRRSWKRRVQADLTELYLVQPLRDMTDRCISVLISVLSSWPLVRIGGCCSFFPFPPRPLSFEYSRSFFFLASASPRFHFRRLSREGGRGGTRREGRNGDTATTNDDLIKDDLDERLITRLIRRRRRSMPLRDAGISPRRKPFIKLLEIRLTARWIEKGKWDDGKAPLGGCRARLTNSSVSSIY